MPDFTLDSSAIITLDEFYAMRSIDENNSAIKASESQLILMINGNSQAVEDHLDRPVVAPSANVIEAFRGDGSASYYVAGCLIAASSTPVLEYHAGAGIYTVVDATSYVREVTKEKGLIELLDGAVFSCNQRYRVTYLPGWLQANVPNSIKLAVVKLVERSIMNLDAKRPKEGLSSESFDTSTTAYNLADWTNEIRNLLMPYRRFAIA